jgi:hypothetical protein
MKVLLLLLSMAAYGGEPRFPTDGTLLYQGEFNILQTRRQEAVHAFTPAGKARLEQLRQEGQTCEHVVRGTYRCVVFLKASEDQVSERVNQRLRKARVVIGPESGTPSLIAKGSSYVEWLVRRQVSFQGQTYPHYRYSILDGSLHKLSLGNPAEHGFLVQDDGTLSLVFAERVQESRDVILSYLVQAHFKR